MNIYIGSVKGIFLIETGEETKNIPVPLCVPLPWKFPETLLRETWLLSHT